MALLATVNFASGRDSPRQRQVTQVRLRRRETNQLFTGISEALINRTL